MQPAVNFCDATKYSSFAGVCQSRRRSGSAVECLGIGAQDPFFFFLPAVFLSALTGLQTCLGLITREPHLLQTYFASFFLAKEVPFRQLIFSPMKKV